MNFTVLIILGVEIFGICTFLLGYVLGSHRSEPIVLEGKTDGIVPDPVSPEDQMLMKKLEEEAKHYGSTQEE
jgi:hypothetical protein